MEDMEDGLGECLQTDTASVLSLNRVVQHEMTWLRRRAETWGSHSSLPA